MKKSLVLTELQAGQDKSEKELNPDILGPVQKLLEYDNQQDRQTLKALGMDTHLRIASDMQDRAIVLESLKKQMNGKIFHVDTIQDLCVKYRLRLLPTKYFRGAVDAEVPAMIKQFTRESGIEMTEAHLMTRFFIMAPPKAFNLKEVVIPKQPSALKKFFDALRSDPVLFYKADENHYRMVHKWGNDFSIFRAIQGWRWKDFNNFFAFGFLVSLVASTFLASAIFPISSYGSVGFYAMALGGAIVGAFIHYSTNSKNNKFLEKNLTPENWNKVESYR